MDIIYWHFGGEIALLFPPPFEELSPPLLMALRSNPANASMSMFPPLFRLLIVNGVRLNELLSPDPDILIRVGRNRTHCAM